MGNRRARTRSAWRCYCSRHTDCSARLFVCAAREEAAATLSRRVDERALEPLVAAFYRVDLDEDEMFPLIVIGTLKRIHTPAAESALLDFLKITPRHASDERYDILKETMMALAEMGSKAAVDLFYR
jgi:hypothetical protein